MTERDLPTVCLDDDPPAECQPACALADRSARGYCPHEHDAALAEYCSVNVDASFCGGPSDAGHDALEEVATTTTTTTAPPPPPPPQPELLPAAGADLAGVALTAALLLAAGRRLTRTDRP